MSSLHNSMPGQSLGTKYVLDRVIGEGGMGIVFEATHVQLKKRFAIKVLRPEVCSPEALTRFELEARAASRLESKHVCRVSDVGTREDGTPYMVMELLDGEDLGALVDRTGPLSLPDAVRHLLQTCEAMEEAHKRGIIHRDLKPENLFLARENQVATIKVLDFGISKHLEEDAVNVTRTQSSIGTPLYMSPEQTRSTKHVDARTDIWSLGVILYELLTGQLPFVGETPGQVAMAVALDKVVPMRSYKPDLPAAIDEVVALALEKAPEDRYPSIRAFARALAPFAPPDVDTSRWMSDAPDSLPNPRASRSGREIEEDRALETATTLHASPPRHDGDAPSTSRLRTLAIGLAVAAAAVIAAIILLDSATTSTARPHGAAATSDPTVATLTSIPQQTVPTAAGVRVEPTTSAQSAPSASAAPTQRALARPTAIERTSDTPVKPVVTAPATSLPVRL